MQMKHNFLTEHEKTLIEWDTRYEIGIPLIDEQHRELLRLTNMLYEACLAGDKAIHSSFQEAARGMVDYVKYHFSAEEKMLENVNYPELAVHKKQHEVLIKDVIEHIRRFEAGQKFVPNNFVRLLKDWILTHIAVSDRLYSEYILNLKKQGLLNNALLGE